VFLRRLQGFECARIQALLLRQDRILNPQEVTLRVRKKGLIKPEPNVVRAEDERRLLQHRSCFEQLTLRVSLMGVIGAQDLAGLRILTDERLVSV